MTGEQSDGQLSFDKRTKDYGFLGICAVTALTVWVFPNVFWFFSLWVGMAIGLPLGMAAAWATSTPRQKIPLSTETIGVLLTGLVFLAHALFDMVPDMASQQRELHRIRSLPATEIVAVSIQGEHQRITIDDQDALRQFSRCCEHANLFYPSHEADVSNFIVQIEQANGAVLRYEAGVPERHRRDISLHFKGHLGWHEILLPGASRWVEPDPP